MLWTKLTSLFDSIFWVFDLLSILAGLMKIILIFTLHHHQLIYIFLGSKQTIHKTRCKGKKLFYMFIIDYLILFIIFLQTSRLLNKKKIEFLSKGNVIFQDRMLKKVNISGNAFQNRIMFSFSLSIIFNFVFLQKLHEGFDNEHVWLP